MREREEHRQMREMRDRGERVEIKYSYFFYNTATVQFYLQNCTVASIAKNLQYLPLPFFDVDDFKGINAKFSLDMALAFFNANALTRLKKPKKQKQIDSWLCFFGFF